MMGYYFSIYRISIVERSQDSGSLLQRYHKIQDHKIENHYCTKIPRDRITIVQRSQDTGSLLQRDHKIQNCYYSEIRRHKIIIIVITRLKIIPVYRSQNVGSFLYTDHKIWDHSCTQITKYGIIPVERSQDTGSLSISNLYRSFHPQTR